MPLTQVIAYDTPGNFTYDSSLIEVAGGKAKLKLVGNPGQTFSQAFSADTGFTYDAAKAEFVGGLLRQKDLTPANSVLGATFTSALDASWIKGASGVATLNGSPTLVGGKLDCTGATNKGIYYQDAVIGGARTIRWKFTPNYTGGAMGGTNSNIITLTPTSGNNDLVVLTHNNSTSIRIGLFNNVGTQILAIGTIFTGTLWSPTAGTEYEFELNIDPAAGTLKLYINGVQNNSMNVGPWTRGTSAVRLHLGAYATTYNLANASYDDVVAFDAVQHSAGYTPGYSVSEVIYAASTATLPAFAYGGVGAVQAFTALAATIPSGSCRFVINNLYWNGSNWVASDGSYAQANDAATATANLGTFPVTMPLTIKVAFPDSATQGAIDDLTVTYTGQIYPTSNPAIVNNSGVNADGLDGFSEVASAAGGDAVRYQLDASGTKKWWNGAAWATSDGTYAQSSTAAEIEANKASLALGAGAVLKVRALLHSTAGSTTPELTSNTVLYNFFAPEPAAPAECIVYGHLKDILGDLVVANAALVVELTKPFFYGNHTIRPSKKTIAVTNDGKVEVSLVETATAGKTYKFSISYTDEAGKAKVVSLGSAAVPNQPTANLVSLSYA